MPLFLRVIKRSRWYPPEDTSWLAAGEIQAEPLADLATRENTLSVFQISDNESNVDQVVAAMAAQRDDLKHFEYALFDQQMIADLNIRAQKAPGDTKDEMVNEWHYDLTELSAQKVVSLATGLLADSKRATRYKDDVKELIANAVRLGRIPKHQLNRKIKEKIDTLPQS